MKTFAKYSVTIAKYSVTIAKYSVTIAMMLGIFLVARSVWNLFHAQALQAVFDIVIGFYFIQDSKIDSLKRTVNLLVEREILRSEKERKR